jgi:hypothetical protein
MAIAVVIGHVPADGPQSRAREPRVAIVMVGDYRGIRRAQLMRQVPGTGVICSRSYPGRHPAQHLAETKPIPGVVKDGPTFIAPDGEMRPSTRMIDPQGSGNAESLCYASRYYQLLNVVI